MPPRSLFVLLMLSLPAVAWAQTPVAAPAQTAAPAVPEPSAPAPAADAKKTFRDTRGYAFPAISRTLRDMQNLAYAMQLRDYCADDRVGDDFVKAQLARFSRITGRDEDCRTLLDY